MTKLEKAKELERQAKQLRKQAKMEEELRRLKLYAQFGEIISEVVGREVAEKDIDGFRNYATGIGSQYINKALSVTS